MHVFRRLNVARVLMDFAENLQVGSAIVDLKNGVSDFFMLFSFKRYGAIC